MPILNNAVPMAVHNQIRWERDQAMQQLKDHGIPFGGVAPDVVEVVRCRDCVHWSADCGTDETVCLKIYSDGAASAFAWQERKPDDFCSYGERRKDDG